MVKEVSRSVSFLRPSVLVVDMACTESDAINRVAALFADASVDDARTREMTGWVLGIDRPIQKLAQRMRARVEALDAVSCRVTFTIDIAFIGRALDGRVFNDVVARLQDPTLRTIKASWFIRQVAAGRRAGDFLTLPVGGVALLAVASLPVLAAAGLAAGRSGSYVVAGVFNGFILADLFLITPVCAGVALWLGLKAASIPRNWRVVVGALCALIAAGFWLSFLATLGR